MQLCMLQIPQLTTDRLLLRGFGPDDFGPGGKGDFGPFGKVDFTPGGKDGQCDK